MLPRTRAVLSRADFGQLERELADRRLLTLIGSRAVEAGGDLVSAGFRAAVERALATARAHGLAVEWATRRVVETLARAEIAALPLKGPLLAIDVHGDVGLRGTADVDLLVRRDRLDDAVGVLMEAGFSAPVEPRRGGGLPDLHFSLAHDRLPQVELHWRVHWYETAFAGDMLARAAPGPDGLLRPDGADLAASLLLFYARDGFHGVRHAADLAAWWDRRGAALPAAFLEDHARRYPGLAPALTAAARLAEVVTGAPALAWLGAGAVSGRRVDVATRLGDWTQHGDRDQLRANISLIGALLGPSGSGRAFARRELLPYDVRPLGRPLHGAKVCARYALALWRVRGDRAWAEVPAV